MTRIARREARHVGGHDVKINDRQINIYLARIVYRCQRCFGELKLHNAGLICKTNPEHRGFIHRDEAKAIQEQQAIEINKLQDFYTIEKGKVIIK